MEKEYYFDQIIINSKQDKQILRDTLFTDELKSECNEFYLRKPSKDAKKAGFKSSVIFVAPTNKFFKTLLQYETILDFYKILKIELAKDVYYPSVGEAELALTSTPIMNMKWATDFFEFKATKTTPTKKIRRCWGEQTNYYGTYKFKKAEYATSSKINDRPCVHKEFRLCHASNIRKRTGIEFIRDFIDYDIESIYEMWVDKYFDHSMIDRMKLGKWLFGWTRRRKFTKREEMRIGLSAQVFCDSRKIDSFAHLKSYLGNLKAEIRKKKGRKTECDRKILALRYDYFRLNKN